MSLLSASELAGLRAVAESAMATAVTVLRRITVETEDGQSTEWATLGDDIIGNLWSQPTPVLTQVSGEIALVNTFRLFVPVDTDITPGDHAVISDRTYTVSDTTPDTTWQAHMTVSLRLVE